MNGKLHRNPQLLTILPPFKLSSLSRTFLKNIWQNLQKCRTKHWKQFVISDVNHAFDPERDMKSGSSISGQLRDTIFENKDSQCRKIQIKIPINSGEIYRTLTVFIVWYPDSKDHPSPVGRAFVPPNIDAMMRQIVTWFCFIVPFVRPDCDCSHHTDVFLLLTSHDSVMPNSGEKLVVDDLFSAYTYTCRKNNEMFIMRQSVWLKALIHESFHTFGIDFSDADFESAKTIIRKLFPGITQNVEIRLYESYTDIWATICYVLLNIGGGGRNKHTVKTKNRVVRSLRLRANTVPFRTIERELHRQCCFAVLQSAKMFRHTKTDMESLLSRNGKYEESLMVFSYHVLRPIYMSDLNRFIEWTARHNDTRDYMRFRKENVDSFAQIIGVILERALWLSQYQKAGQVLSELHPTHQLSRTAVLTYPMEIV